MLNAVLYPQVLPLLECIRWTTFQEKSWLMGNVGA